MKLSESKKCYGCKKTLSLDFFAKDKYRSDGRTNLCKYCKKEKDQKRHKAKTTKGIKTLKDNIRLLTKKEYKGVYTCSVLSCGKKAELHHIDYKNHKEVIPLCRQHHCQVHHLEFLYKEIIKQGEL